MSEQARAARGVFWGALERGATQGISFLVVLVLARLLGPEIYGLAALAATLVLFGQMLLGETFSEAVVQAETLEPAHLSSLFWMLFAAGIVVAAAFFVGADALANLLGQPAAAPLLRALALLPLVSAAQAVPMALFRRALDFRALAASSTTGAVVGAVAGIACAFAGFGVWAFVVNLLAQSVATASLIWVRSSFRPRQLFSRAHLGDLWSYGQYTFLLRIAAYAANQSPRILVGYFFGPAVLGLFSLALRLVEIMHQLLAVPVMNVLIPLAAKYRADPMRLERGIIGSTQLCALVCVPAFAGLALIAPTAMPLLFGPRWMEGAIIVQIFAAFGIVGASGLLSREIIAGLGRPDINLVSTLCAAALSVGLIVVAASWGPIAAAIVFVIRGYATLPLQPLIIERLSGVSAAAQYRVYGPVLLATAFMCAVVLALEAATGGALSPALLAIAEVAAGVAAYGAALYFVARPALRLGVSMLPFARARQGTA